MMQALNLRQQLSINLRNCYSSRRATQNMSATRNSPTIDLNLRALPLSAVTVSLHYLSRHLHSIVTYHPNLKCIFEDFLPCYCYATKAKVEQFTLEFRNLLYRQGADMSELQAHNCILSKQ